jgi:hypothetical protein
MRHKRFPEPPYTLNPWRSPPLSFTLSVRDFTPSQVVFFHQIFSQILGIFRPFATELSELFDPRSSGEIP